MDHGPSLAVTCLVLIFLLLLYFTDSFRHRPEALQAAAGPQGPDAPHPSHDGSPARPGQRHYPPFPSAPLQFVPPQRFPAATPSFPSLPVSSSHLVQVMARQSSNPLIAQGTLLASKHPLQRLPSPSRGVSALVHLAGLVSFFYSFRYLVVTPNPLGDLWGWHFQHLTILTLAMTLLAFVLGILADLTLSARLFYLKNILAVVAAPLEFCVTVLYWGIRSIDPMLLLHPDSPMPPVIVDHSFHTFPTLLCLLDLLLLSPPWTLTFIPSLGLAGALAAAYWFWVEACAAHNNGVYAYPLFGLLDTWSRVQVFVGAAVIFSVAVVILGSLQTWANGSLKVVNGVSRGEDERPGHIKGE